MEENMGITAEFDLYTARLSNLLMDREWGDVQGLAQSILNTWKNSKQLFLCGNGGSAANAVHLANDFLYGVRGESRMGIKVEALTSNSSVLTCLANDVSYSQIFSIQIETKANEGDLLLVLSGSGNSSNVVRALEAGSAKGMTTYAILGLTGGECLQVAQNVIHFPGADMQMSEDLQLIVGHMCMQWLKKMA